MSDFARQMKGNFQGIVAPIACKFAEICRQKMAFYGRQGVLKQFLTQRIRKGVKQRDNVPLDAQPKALCTLKSVFGMASLLTLEGGFFYSGNYLA